ncbi:hypothetical protein CYMTET_39296 [Cymbomonas tetramitiformis]|uniref:Uncharacterized protein n=1 Tax=Cymbomonas tetramitiformis TaxID=36881 RepID=A0AAE0F426_9CHLO|nr:hypothetical protein CYMTET_39296 [Cymbomonas tetramitiformis]
MNIVELEDFVATPRAPPSLSETPKSTAVEDVSTPAKSAASRREKSKATEKREREDAEDEERVKKAKAQEEQQQRDNKKVRLGEEKVRLAEEKARKMEKALAGVASAADAKHAVENTKKTIEEAVLLREHEMKVEAAEAERKSAAILFWYFTCFCDGSPVPPPSGELGSFASDGFSLAVIFFDSAALMAVRNHGGQVDSEVLELVWR